MTDFIVSARKYRPTNFSEVIGQKSITSTLVKAIQTNHLAHSFLFCGPRGVGKTTCARILAKTINCLDVSEDVKPCNKCSSCTSFNTNHSFDIHELDAASNNSVDDIRSLVDQVRFAPQIGKYNIYIIDEVHMLSSSAFNAFLKTLEEPPPHAIFILATTEKNKIIPTILSRCQIFDFKSINSTDIVSHLDFVSKSEGIISEKKALEVISQKSDGSLRDSLSMFDRLVDSSNLTLTYKDVIENLNILDYDYYLKITDNMISKDITSVLLLFDNILKNGFDAHQFIVGLSTHFRNLLVCKDPETFKLLEILDDLKDLYINQSKKCELSFIIHSLEICNNCDFRYKNTKNKRLLIELSLIKMANISVDAEKKKQDLKIEITDDIINRNDISNNPKNQQNETNKHDDKINVRPEKESHKNVSNRIKVKKTEFSLKDIISNENTLDKESNNFQKKDNNFTQIEMLEIWKDYSEHIQSNGETNLYIILDTCNPIIKDNFIISVNVINITQEKILKENIISLIDFLRSKLNNDYIEININIEKDVINTTPYTSKEKFERMKESNSDLNLLQQKLGLDTDY